MSYYLAVFSPQTWRTFNEAGGTVAGFPDSKFKLARERVKPGDWFICYMTGESRFCGLLKVESGVYFDDNPVFDDPDRFTTRFKVRSVIALDIDSSIDIRLDEVWSTLTFTKDLPKGSTHWTSVIQNPFRGFDDGDATFLVEILTQQQSKPQNYPSSSDYQCEFHTFGTKGAMDSTLEAENSHVQDEDYVDDDGSEESESQRANRESIQMQAKVALVGAEWDFLIWVPRNDRNQILQHIPQSLHQKFVESPPQIQAGLNPSIEQIDVLWLLQPHAIARAFEIEHTTPIYSGLLRMSDLLAIQPNINLQMHIVAPFDRLEKFQREITRPTFQLEALGPLYTRCSFIPYDSFIEWAGSPYLPHMKDTVIKGSEILHAALNDSVRSNVPTSRLRKNGFPGSVASASVA